MHNASTIHLLLTAHGIDPTKFRGLYPPPGIVVVEMLPGADRVGQILLPDAVSDKYRPDVAIVLATGPDISLPVGSMVAVRPYDGQWIEGFEMGGYKTANQVRFVGRTSLISGEIDAIDWDETIPLTFVGEEFDMVATGRNLIIRRDPVVDQEFGLHLAEEATYRTGMAEVLSIGPDCDLATRVGPVQVGDRIHYNGDGILDFAFGGDPDLAIIPDLAVNLVIRPEPEVAAA